MLVAVLLSVLISFILGGAVGFFLPTLLRNRRKQRPKTTNLDRKSLDGQENIYLAPQQAKLVPAKYSTNSLKSYPEKPLNNQSVNFYPNDLLAKTHNEAVGTPGQTSRKFYM